MDPRSVERILYTVPETAVVLDVGGWGKCFTRADWVLDRMPYETRGLYGQDGDGPQRFGPDTWVQRDICDKEPWPFADKSIDFVVCSHTLEDVRDPVWVCHELNRVARAGYIEVPSRLEEQSYGFQGKWAGWDHHHWLIDIGDGRIDFTLKHHAVHGFPGCSFPRGFRFGLTESERIQTLWWEGGFECSERYLMTEVELTDYLAGFVRRELAKRDQGRLRTVARENQQGAAGAIWRGWGHLRRGEIGTLSRKVRRLVMRQSR